MKLSNAEIADKLDGMEAGGVDIIKERDTKLPLLSIYRNATGTSICFIPSDLLAFCRAVCERCGLRIMNGKVHDVDDFYKEDGIAAVTRDKKEGGE